MYWTSSQPGEEEEGKRMGGEKGESIKRIMDKDVGEICGSYLSVERLWVGRSNL